MFWFCLSWFCVVGTFELLNNFDLGYLLFLIIFDEISHFFTYTGLRKKFIKLGHCYFKNSHIYLLQTMFWTKLNQTSKMPVDLQILPFSNPILYMFYLRIWIKKEITGLWNTLYKWSLPPSQGFSWIFMLLNKWKLVEISMNNHIQGDSRDAGSFWKFGCQHMPSI